MTHPGRFARNLLRFSGIGLAALACSACAVSRPTSAERGPVQAIYQETVERGQSDDRPSTAGVARVGKRASPSQAAAIGSQPKSQGVIQQVQFWEPPQDCPPARSGVGPQSQCPPITACPPDARWACPVTNPFAAGMVARSEPAFLAEKFPDEYLCDGGDRDIPVHYDQFNRLGLDTEDAVAEFIDQAGNNHVRPSTRVCIYAPRFSTIRTISRPVEGMNLDEVGGVGQSVGTDSMHTRLKVSHHIKNEMTNRVIVRSRASGLESEQYDGGLSSIRRVTIHEKLLNIYQDLAFVQFGKIETKDAARLNFGLNAAMIWTREQYPVIEAKTETAVEGTYSAHAATIVGIEEKGGPGDLRVVKLADKQTAQPGDIVEFTIRYDNLGTGTVHHVRIVDNLTPRLAYVDDSATSDREGRLVVQDNGEGSLVLVWELTQPLPPKTGGVVSFKARVR